MPKDVETATPAGAEEPGAGRAGTDPLAARVRAVAGRLEPLLARADAVRQERAADSTAAAESGRRVPRWTDVFTTQFTEFSNRPR